MFLRLYRHLVESKFSFNLCSVLGATELILEIMSKGCKYSVLKMSLCPSSERYKEIRAS